MFQISLKVGTNSSFNKHLNNVKENNIDMLNYTNGSQDKGYMENEVLIRNGSNKTHMYEIELQIHQICL